jgi:Protein of unknown function (DUF2846)
VPTHSFESRRAAESTKWPKRVVKAPDTYARSCARWETAKPIECPKTFSKGGLRNGGVMFRNGWAVIAAVLLFGCADTREGLDFAAVSRTSGGPKNGQGRIVVLREITIVGSADGGYPVKLDGEPIGDLRTGTFIFRDRPAGRHELSVSKWDFPGVTKQEINIAPGRTYFYEARLSERAKAMTVGSFAGLAGLAVTAVATSGDSNPGLVDFVLLDEAAGRQMISELRLAEGAAENRVLAPRPPGGVENR